MEYEGLTFVTVRGAGHEVPRHRPEQALVLFQHFLLGEPMPAEVSFTFWINLLMVTNKQLIMPPSAAYIGLRMMLILICRQKVPVSSSFLVRRLMDDDDSSTTNVEC